MMLPLKDLVAKHSMKVGGILHVGARIGEEAPLYRELGVRVVWWIEANPAVIPTLARNVTRLGHHVIEGLVHDHDGGKVGFHVTNYDGMSSSILEFGTHKSFSPDIKFVRTLQLRTWKLDTLVAKYRVGGCNMLVMDLQGAELLCLRGAESFLRGVDYIVTEVNSDEVYVGCAKIQELDEHLADFERVETLWVGTQGWGDALYVRRRAAGAAQERLAAEADIRPEELAETSKATHTRFHVVIPSYNCGQWIDRTLESVATQEHRPESVIVIDDASTDPAYGPAALAKCQSLVFKYIRNDVNRKCPHNIWSGIRALDAAPDDVIFLLDGDDFLPHAKVLSRLAEVYSDPVVWLTYGNYQPHPTNTGQTGAAAYPPDVIAARSFRRYRGAAYNHPLTFRKHLWDHVEEADLKDSSGEWFRGGYDCVIMMPMLEMAAPSHFRFLDEWLYTYNAINPISDSHANRSLIEHAMQVLSRPVKGQLVS
jgi:FkbM family methyltransferase